MSEFSSKEKSALIARLARGKSIFPERAAVEAVAIDKLMTLLDELDPAPTPDGTKGESN